MHYILAPVNVYFLWFLDINCKALISLSLIKEISSPGVCNYRCQGLPILEVGLAQMFTEIGQIKRQYKVDLIYIWFIFVAKSRSFMRLNVYAFVHIYTCTKTEWWWYLLHVKKLIIVCLHDDNSNWEIVVDDFNETSLDQCWRKIMLLKKIKELKIIYTIVQF